MNEFYNNITFALKVFPGKIIVTQNSVALLVFLGNIQIKKTNHANLLSIIVFFE